MIWLLLVAWAVSLVWVYGAANQSGIKAGYRLGHQTGHDRVVQWMLLNAAMPEAWDPTNEWVDD